MNEHFLKIAAIIGTILIYWLARKLHKRMPISLLLPIVTATAAIVILLLLFEIPYEAYMEGGEWISKLLGPAIVALAYPLYENKEILKKYIFPIISGTLMGAVIGITTGVLLTKWAGFADPIIYSITPKSVTTPIAMEIAHSIGGIMPLAAAFVMIAGVSGGVLGPSLFKLFKIEYDVSRGIGFGSASHAIGTASAMGTSPLAGSISSVAMSLSAIIVSIITPPLIALLL
jgi:predicted murein hydrolase (TIGR00659 family)